MDTEERELTGYWGRVPYNERLIQRSVGSQHQSKDLMV